MSKTFEIYNLDEAIHLVGKTIRTTNAEGKSIIEISSFWQEFYSNGEHHKISNKTDDRYCYGIYSNYESDERGYYDFTIAYQVDQVGQVYEGFTEITIEPASFAMFQEFKAMDLHCKIGVLWNRIWSSGIDRKFHKDYEVYEAETTCGENPQMKIYISINS